MSRRFVFAFVAAGIASMAALPSTSFAGAPRAYGQGIDAKSVALDQLARDAEVTTEFSQNVCGNPGHIVTVKVPRYTRIDRGTDTPAFQKIMETVKVYGVTATGAHRTLSVIDSETCVD